MRRDLIALPDDSKVWIYQSTQLISDEATENIKNELYDFTMKWASHGADIDCYAHLFHHQFIVCVADESKHVSGCSIDSSVHLVKEIGKRYNLDFFDRMNYAYLANDMISTVHHSKLKEAYANGTINDETLFFNNLVSDKNTFLTEWIIPLSQSWHKKFIT